MYFLLQSFFWGLPIVFLIGIQYRLYAMFLPERFSYRHTLQFSALALIFLLWINFFWVPSSLRTLVTPLLHILYLFLLFRGPLWGRVLCSIFACAFLVLSEAVSLPFLALLGWNGVVHNENPFFWSTLCNYLMLLWGYICYVLLRHVRLLIRNTLGPHTWFSLFLCLFISIANMMILFFHSPIAQQLLGRPEDQWILLLANSNKSTLVLIILQILFLCLLVVLAEQAGTQSYERAQALIAKQEAEELLERYRHQALELQRLRAIRHDLRGHLSAIDALAEAEDFARQAEYIDRLLTGIADHKASTY